MESRKSEAPTLDLAPPLETSWLERIFKLKQHGSTVRTEMIAGVTTFITQKMMMTDPNDPMQKQMLYMMPIMITVMFVIIPLPAGVLLYTVVSNFFTMGQYMVLKRMYPTTTPPAGGQTIDVQPIKPGSK